MTKAKRKIKSKTCLAILAGQKIVNASPGDRSGRHGPDIGDVRRHRKRDGHAQGHSDPGSQRRCVSILGSGIQGAG